MPTDKELMKQAFAALFEGDLKTRDDCIARIRRRNDAREAESIKLAEAAKPYFTVQ